MRDYMDEYGDIHAPDKYICTECVPNKHLKKRLVGEASMQDSCSYCGHEVAAPLRVLAEALFDVVKFEYEDGANYGSAIDDDISRELLSPQDTAEIVAENCENHSALKEQYFDEIVSDLNDSYETRHWVKKDWVSIVSSDDAMSQAWDEFKDIVTNKCRFSFWALSDPSERLELERDGAVHPANLLERVHELILALDLLKQIEPDIELFRAHTVDEDDISFAFKAGRLGTIPRERATHQNRMSPPGMPLFYCATEAETARLESGAIDSGKREALATFSSTKTITVVDLFELPMPDLMDPIYGEYWREITFMHKFIREISAPIGSDTSHLEYVPMQVVTDFLLNKHFEGQLVDGIRYPSAVHKNHASLALRVSNDDCLNEAPGGQSERLQVVLKDAVWVHDNPVPLDA